MLVQNHPKRSIKNSLTYHIKSNEFHYTSSLLFYYYMYLNITKYSQVYEKRLRLCRIKWFATNIFLFIGQTMTFIRLLCLLFHFNNNYLEIHEPNTVWLTSYLSIAQHFNHILAIYFHSIIFFCFFFFFSFLWFLLELNDEMIIIIIIRITGNGVQTILGYRIEKFV